jgi:hypothetical protein
LKGLFRTNRHRRDSPRDEGNERAGRPSAIDLAKEP